MVNYARAFSQSELGKYFEWIIKLVICNKTKDYFSWEHKKINVKFHNNSENIGKILKISYVRWHVLKFDFYFLGLS